MDEIGKLFVLYIDQPVGTGFSGNEPAKNNTDATQQSYRWLTAFNAMFPGLTANNSYLMGESYAGIYLSFSAVYPYGQNGRPKRSSWLPANLNSIIIGKGLLINAAALTVVSVNAFLHEEKRILKIPQETIETFVHADHQCEFDRVLRQVQHPPHGKNTFSGNLEWEISSDRSVIALMQQQQRLNLSAAR